MEVASAKLFVFVVLNDDNKDILEFEPHWLLNTAATAIDNNR